MSAAIDYRMATPEEAWFSHLKTIKGVSTAKVFDHHDREDVVQSAAIIFARRFSKYQSAPDGKHNFNFSVQHVAKLAITSIKDAVRNKFRVKLTIAGRDQQKMDLAAGIKKKCSEYERIDFCDIADACEAKSVTGGYRSATDQYREDMANNLIEYANAQTDKRFAHICQLLMLGNNQEDIAVILGIQPCQVSKLIKKHREAFLKMGAGGQEMDNGNN